MSDFLANIRYSFRQFRKAPVFTAAAVLTLALGIGGTTAIFSLIHSVMLKSLPVTDPARLYRIGTGNDCCVEGGPQDQWGMYSYPLYERLKQNLPEFEELTAFQAGPNMMSVRRESDKVAKPLRAEYVTGTYFNVFGIRPFIGRLLAPSDDQPNAVPAAVLSYHAWQTTYGGDPSVIGSTLMIDGHAFTLIGVAPPGFFGDTLRSEPPAIWIPTQQEPLLRGEGTLLRQPVSAWLRVIGRLKPGASIAGVAPRMTELLRQWMVNDSGYPANWLSEVKRLLPKQTIDVVPAGSGVADMKEDYGRSLEILLAVCGLVLLIACANVANLLLARAAGRRGQTAVRVALGASRRQIVGQAFMESVLLAILGGIAGLAIAMGASRLLLTLAFHQRYLPIDTAPSLPVLGFAFALSLLTGIVFGTAPAWAATHTHPIEALRGAGRGTRDRATPARKVLLIAQAVLSVVLVAGATMLARSLGNLENQQFGFATQDHVMVEINPPAQSYTEAQLNSMYRDLEQRLLRIDGVQKAGLGMYTPLTDNWSELVVIDGHPPAQFNEQSAASWDRVSANFLDAVGQHIVKGRGFTDADNENSEHVAVVNESFVRRFFPNEEPLDHHMGIDLPQNAGRWRIVGVVSDAKYTQPREGTRPMFFVPLMQHEQYDMSLMQKLDHSSHLVGGIMLVTRRSPAELEPAVTKELSAVDPNLTLIAIRTMGQQVALNFDQERAVASLAGLFAGMALLLAAIGLYGVMAYMVAQSTNEIGVRMALGADRFRVISHVLSGAFRRVAIGLLIGIPLAIGAGKLLSAQLWGVKAWDPLALLVAAGSLGVCAFIAAMIPALRAASISPMTALRAE
ncbi:MAG: ABC transporter permease [Terriglobales bacterium]